MLGSTGEFIASKSRVGGSENRTTVTDLWCMVLDAMEKNLEPGLYGIVRRAYTVPSFAVLACALGLYSWQCYFGTAGNLPGRRESLGKGQTEKTRRRPGRGPPPPKSPSSSIIINI